MDETAAIARLEACGVIPVVVIEDASRAIDLAHALVAGGIDVVEVTLRRPAGLAALEAIACRSPARSSRRRRSSRSRMPARKPWSAPAFLKPSTRR